MTQLLEPPVGATRGQTPRGSGDGSRAPRILALHWYDVCSPWRIDIPTRALHTAGFEVRQGHIKQVTDLGDADILLLHRPNSSSVLKLIETAHARGVPVVVDVDDLFLADVLPESAPFSKVWHPDFKRLEAEAQARAGLIDWSSVADTPSSNVMDRFHACLRAADAVTVTTQPLAEAYSAFNSNVRVVPNFYDDANPLWNASRPPRATVNIGFAGTDHHLDNLALLKGALEPVLRRHTRARLVEAGGPALLPQIDAPPEQLVHLGTQPFEAFPLLLLEMDLVLAPLVDDPFMRSKSNIRCMTGGLVGLPAVASPAGPYAEYVEHGVNGFLASSPEEWTACVDRLVSDAALREQMGRANRERAREFAISKNINRWTEVYDELLSRRRRA